MVAAECRDIATAGGLGDVVRELSKAIRQRGVRVSIAIPYYGIVTKRAVSIGQFTVRFGGKAWKAEWFRGTLDGVTIYLLRKPEFFDGEFKTVYIHSQHHPFEDDGRRFAFFSSAVLGLLQDYMPLDSINTLHCHDWHTGVLFTLLKYDPRYRELAGRLHTLFTVHNLEYQGIRPFTSRIQRPWFSFSDWFPDLYQTLRSTNVIHDLRHPDPPTHWFNPMRAAIHLADQVNTVSPTYAGELTRADNPKLNFLGGRGLEDMINARKQEQRFHGILNGLDYTIHTPARLTPPFDATLPRWSAQRMQHKHAVVAQLPRMITELAHTNTIPAWNANTLLTKLSSVEHSAWKTRPLLVMVTRAADQKVKMLLEMHNRKSTLAHILAREVSLVILATGEREAELHHIVNGHSNGLFICAFERTLAQRLYAGGDLFLMPSDFEPCGISQLISMRYGCLPLVHGIGGLRDTVQDRKTGFVFHGKTRAQTRQALLDTLDAALRCHRHERRQWRQMQRQAMQTRFDWSQSVTQYLSLYDGQSS